MKCNQSGVCCKLFQINLTETEYRSKKYKTIFEDFDIKDDDFARVELIGANILAQNQDGSCIYLQNNKCSIHKNRPQNCRAFFCTSKDPWFKEMIVLVNNHKKEQYEQPKKSVV